MVGNQNKSFIRLSEKNLRQPFSLSNQCVVSITERFCVKSKTLILIANLNVIKLAYTQVEFSVIKY